MTPAALPDEGASAARPDAGRTAGGQAAGATGARADGARADGARALAPAAFAGRLALLVAIVLVARAAIVLLLHRADLADGYRWDSFLAAVPGMLAGIVLGSRTPRRPSASWASVLQVAVAIALVHLALSLVMARLAGLVRPPDGPLDGGVMLGVAAFNAGLAILIGAWAGRRMTRLGDQLGASP